MKNAIITGGKGVLGQAIAAALTATGWQVLAPSHDEIDILQATALKSYFKQNPPDLLVCCAGITRDAPLARLSETAWDETLAINLKSALHCAQLAEPHMARKKAGHIIFISSFSALRPPIGQAAYATSKAALLGLTKQLAQELGPQNIRVNAILPGFMDSPITRHLGQQRRDEILADHHLGRLNTPAEVGKFIHHLHHQMPHTSGQIFQLDSRVA